MTEYFTKEVFTLACAVAFIALCVRIFFEPTIAAYQNRHTNFVQILVSNVLFGWTLVLWVPIWIWACSQDNREVLT